MERWPASRPEVTAGPDGTRLNCTLDISGREREILRHGGLLNYISEKVRG